MRATVLFALAALVCGPAAAPARQKDAAATPAAERTRTKALKAKVSVAFTDARLGDVLKEMAAQVDMTADELLMWTYGPGFPFAQKVTFSSTGKPLDATLDAMFTKLGGGLGYVVVSNEEDRHDGWVRLTTTGERGVEKVILKATVAEEAQAAETLALAKKLIDTKKDDQAKTVLAYLVKKYPTAAAAAEAKELLAKLEK